MLVVRGWRKIPKHRRGLRHLAFSDEYSRYGEFTGAFVGMACVDSMLHRKEALFDFFSYRAVEDAIIE